MRERRERIADTAPEDHQFVRGEPIPTCFYVKSLEYYFEKRACPYLLLREESGVLFLDLCTFALIRLFNRKEKL
jgi:hypothetical protein